MNCRWGVYRNYLAILISGLVLCCLFGGKPMQIVHAEETRFDVEAKLLPSDKDTFDIQLTIENCGEDWEGVVQLLVNGTQVRILTTVRMIYRFHCRKIASNSL